MATILVTGGTGFIGSHTCVELLSANHDVVILDNLYNSKEDVVKRIEQISGRSVRFYKGDILDDTILDQIFTENTIDAVIHFAALKAVGESMEKPLEYYHNNVGGAVNLYLAMQRHGVHTIVFSSSATVYGQPQKVPCAEDAPIQEATNPYGTTKIYNEKILSDLCAANKDFSVMLLRYFNPIGAHPSGLLGEVPNGVPNNLTPYVAQVALGQREFVRVWGNDYDTPDGTGVRDYIHVVDLAKGHVNALDYALHHHGVQAVNLGTGVGYSVLDVIHAYEKVCGHKIPYQIMERRGGDIAENYADVSKAKTLLGWSAQYDLNQMVADSWHFMEKLNENQ